MSLTRDEREAQAKLADMYDRRASRPQSFAAVLYDLYAAAIAHISRSVAAKAQP